MVFGKHSRPSSLRIRRGWKKVIAERFASLVLAMLFVLPLPIMTKFHIFDTALAADQPTISSVSPSNGPTAGGAPVTLSGTNFEYRKVVQVVGGNAHTCALTDDNKIYCWGRGTQGQLGNGSYANATTPSLVNMSGVLSGKTIVSLSASFYNTCALTSDGYAYCWGDNTYGQLGDNSTTASPNPVAVFMTGALNGLTITKMANGSGHTCAIASNSKVYCWGRNNNGQLGDRTAVDKHVPTKVYDSSVLSGKILVDIDGGNLHTCVVDSNGVAYCWGDNQYGQVGDNTIVDKNEPTAVSAGALAGKTVTAIRTGFYFSCAIANDDKAYCWGQNSFGQLGDASNTQRRIPVAVDTTGVLSGKTVTKIYTGGYYACALDSLGVVHCWGDSGNGYAELGNNTNVGSNIPTNVDTSGVLNGKTITSMADGNYHACAITNEEKIACWGDNSEYQRGDGTATQSLTPQAGDTVMLNASEATVTFGGASATNVTVQSSTTITATTPAHASGSVDVIVTNSDTQQGVSPNGYMYDYPAPTISSITPDSGPSSGLTSVTVTGSNFVVGSSIMEVATGSSHTCALTSENKLYCWGSNNYGQLGKGDANNSTIPVLADVSGALNGKSLTALSAGGNTSCTLDSNGKAYCWGDNTYGQLGDNSTTPRVVPTAVDTSGVLSGKTLTSISTSGASTCAVDSDGKAYCWGSNSGTGQLGDGTQTESHVPIAVDTSGVLSGKTVSKVVAGTTSACAIANDAHVYCWGKGSLGQLGNGTINDTSVPVAVTTSGVLSGKTVTDISVMGDHHACALTSEGKAYCWGSNVYGELGDNSGLTLSPDPVAVDTSGVLSGKTIISVRAAGVNSCAVDSDGKAYCWGNGAIGQLGNSGTSNTSVPVAVTTSGVLNGKTITTLDSTLSHDCAITTDGHLYCWGYNNSGQLGNGLVDNSSVPVSPYSTDMVIEHTMLSFDGHDAGKIIVQDSSHIIALTPTHAVGAVDVTVTNPDNKTASLTNGYTYNISTQPPDAPTGLSALPNSANVDLSWTAPSNDGGSPITDYTIEYSDNGGSTWSEYTHTPSAATSASVSGLQPGTTYSFRVMAINSAGVGLPSNITTGSPSFLTVFSSGDVDLSVIPTTDARMSNNSHTLTTSTNNSTGYALMLETDSSDRDLTNGTSTIIPAIGTYTTPGALAANQWGYRINGGNFTGGATTSETNVASSAFDWAGVPANGSPDTIHSTDSAAENDSLDVWYAMSADTSSESGTYTNTVLYTAVAN